jgi:hypothetical protein
MPSLARPTSTRRNFDNVLRTDAPTRALRCRSCLTLTLALATCLLQGTSQAQPADQAARIEASFRQQVQPLLAQYCLRCHNAETMKSGIRLDVLNGALEDRHLALWSGIREQLLDEIMPPEDEPQPTAEQRTLLTTWIDQALIVARSRQRDKHGTVRRLTVTQFRHTLRDLLGLEDDLTAILPPDAVSKDGFLNNGQTMQLSPLLVEAYFRIAEQALDRCIVDEQSQPRIQSFRMELGAAINAEPYPEPLVLGALNHLLQNQDFVVTQPVPTKPFDFEPIRMQTKFRFIEGYQGNDTVRGWRDFDSIYHAVFACMRGDEGYPKGQAYQAVPLGLLLRPAIPSAELFQVQSTYGPKANFKISLRELPDSGQFRLTVRAAKYDDGLLLDPGAERQPESADGALVLDSLNGPRTLTVERAGIYQVDVDRGAVDTPPGDGPQILSLQIGERHFSGTLAQPAFLVVRLPSGPLTVAAQYAGSPPPARIVFTPLAESHELARRFAVFEQRLPSVGVYLGLRRDCGSTLAQVGRPQVVGTTELNDYVFQAAISNFPNPDVEQDNVNYLAGIREIGIRSEYTDGRDMPRLLVRSVDFEGPYYATWPPATHRNIFIPSDHQDDPAVYAREIVRSFAGRAFRRPITDQEEAALWNVWQSSYAEAGDFEQSIRDALLVVMTSPQFLFLIEDSRTPAAEPIDDYELASKLSYFLWDTAPDERLLELAADDRLRDSLDAELDRLIEDPRFEQFTEEFVSQWLSLDKLDVVEVSREHYPELTRDTKAHLRREPVRFFQYLVRNNLPLKNLIDCEVIVANEVIADYYGLADRTESGFEFVVIPHESRHLGGLLTQAGILAGLSNGRESNPVKRGAWLARKIIAEPPDDPPPNVPALPEGDSDSLTLREKIERHRNQEGCAKCHAGIDPWGLPFEQYDAGGLFKQDQSIDSRSTLPDKTEIADVQALKSYLAEDRLDQVAFSVMKHLAIYATGRDLTYNEIEFIREKGLELKPAGYRLQDLLRFVVRSEMFLEK